MSAPAPHLLFADISDYQAGFNAARYARAGRRVVMVKRGEGAGNAGGEHAAARVQQAHQMGLHVIHYLMALYHAPPEDCMRAYCERIKPSWRAGDRMLIDVESYSGPPADAAAWVADTQLYLRREQHAPRALLYSPESYLAEAGLTLANLTSWWHIAAYDGRLLGRGEPKLPRGCKAHLLAKQYTDGQDGAPPHTAPGIGACDSSILTRAGATLLGVNKTPLLKRRHLPGLKPRK